MREPSVKIRVQLQWQEEVREQERGQEDKSPGLPLSSLPPPATSR